MISVRFQGKPFNIIVIQVYAPTTNAKDTEAERFYEDLQDLLELTPKKKKKKSCPFYYRDWNAKVGSQEISGVMGKFDLGVQNEAEQRLTVLPRECTGHSKHPLPTTQEMTPHGHRKMVNTKIRLIIFFAAEDGAALYSQSKKKKKSLGADLAQIISALLQNSDLS